MTKPSAYMWEVVGPRLKASSVFGEAKSAHTSVVGVLSRDLYETLTDEDVASALSCLMLASTSYELLAKRRTPIPPVAIVRASKSHQQNAAVLTSPMLPLMVPMSFYSTGIPVRWMFTELNVSRREFVFTFIEWTYGDMAAECPIAQVYKDDMSPCDTCTINGPECKEKHLKSMWSTADLPAEVKKLGPPSYTPSNCSPWHTVFDAFRYRLPASHAHLREHWLGKEKRAIAGFHVSKDRIEITMGSVSYLVNDRVRKVEAAQKAKHTIAKQDALCSKCVLKGDCTLFKYSSSCVAFPSRNDLLEYVVHNDPSMSVEDALTSLILTTFSAHYSARHPLPPAPRTRVSRHVVIDGLNQSGRWCVRILGDYQHLRNPGQKDNVQIKLASYEELCLWMMAENPPLWSAYQDFLTSSVADKIRKNFSWVDACAVMTSQTRAYVYSSSMAPYTSRTFGEESDFLTVLSGGASTRYLSSNPWWTAFNNVHNPSRSSGAEIPAGAIRTTFTA